MKKKNILLTWIAACCLGAGQMYLGYMKRGLSMMLIAVVDCFMVGFFNNGVFLLFLPVIWAYAFFDTFNLRNQDEPKPDAMLFDLSWFMGQNWKRLLESKHGLLGWVLIGVGAYALYNNFVAPTLWEIARSFGVVWLSNFLYGMPTLVTNCSNNYGPYQFPEKLIPLFINNIRHRRPLPVYGRGENVRDWLYVEDHARAIDLIFHRGRVAETYNIGGFNEWKNIDLIRVVIRTVDRLLGRREDEDMDLITFVTDRPGHDMRYAIDSSKLQRELGWEPSLQFEEGIEKTVRWYLDNQAWMDNITSGEYEKYYDEMYRNR